MTEDAVPGTATGNVLANDLGSTTIVRAVARSATNVGTDVAGQFGTFHIAADGSFTYTLYDASAAGRLAVARHAARAILPNR